ncbi:T6SS phospholipase effector Tle1-like catalytic domain-containing protein [Noviherbaspirillum sp. ST9]|uniref:T6SS phospholipase effector Tle1-like catalytic domain-containing protein n=1 Tax=Noviherbaspirillum sp. ST9 TaxID=3401606 RepID=UPI003B586BEA
MTAILALPFDASGIDYADPSIRARFFSGDDETTLRALQLRESPPFGNPSASCDTNLFFGFFHDGTRNNYGASLKAKNHTQSNIARLYSCFPGRSVPGVIPAEPMWGHAPDQFTHFFRVYTPGVGSAFDLVDDSGEGKDETLGAAMAYKGEPRIIWTLLQAMNNLHRYFHKDAPLITADEARQLYRKIILTRTTLQRMADRPPAQFDESNPREDFVARQELTTLLERLHKAIAYHMPDKDGRKPRNTDPGVVKQIYISVFGFSRGAAAGRAFANWLVALCKLDAELLGKSGTTLGGFPVNFDFLGLFDTVSSVGLANTLNTADGHWGWADAEVSLRVPKEFIQCLHLVSGHEIRRSFPLDSISYKGLLESGRTEVVYPGVHSDVGGGYLPMEQGKGKDGTGKDHLSRLPLAHMYRAARLAGVPLKLELVTQQSVKDDFKINPSTLAAFNQYVSHAKVTSGPLTYIMREQCKFQMLWRHLRRQGGASPLEDTQSYKDALQVDKNDLRGANAEFTDEIAEFERWRDGFLNPAPDEWDPHGRAQMQRKPAEIARPAPGFKNRREGEWEEIARFWGIETLPEEVAEFFDRFVHDSRAWFKLTGTESADVEKELRKLVQKMKSFDENARYEHQPDPLTPEEREWAMEYAATGQVPDMKTGGREPAWFGQAGYLRYRKVYAGGDRMLISEHRRQLREHRLAVFKGARQQKAA